MDHTPQHPPFGFTAEPKLNPRINNSLPINVLSCAKTVEISIFSKNVFLRVQHPLSLNTKDRALRNPKETGVIRRESQAYLLGHTEMDVITRWHRMLGHNTLWLPGTDHAGIATQMVVERKLAKEGLTKLGLGREEFEKRIWDWKDQYGATITSQMVKIGDSCDWSRERFTMDPGLSRAVREIFVRLYEKGLIYRGEYMVNWCPRCRTALNPKKIPRNSKLYGRPSRDILVIGVVSDEQANEVNRARQNSKLRNEPGKSMKLIVDRRQMNPICGYFPTRTGVSCYAKSKS